MRRLTKPCPLCGGMPETFQGRHIRCSDCGNIQTAGWEHWNQLPEWPGENPEPWTTLSELRPGAIFETTDGIRALVTEYETFNDGTQRNCYLLESGESAHFEHCNDQMVREISPAKHEEDHDCEACMEREQWEELHRERAAGWAKADRLTAWIQREVDQCRSDASNHWASGNRLTAAYADATARALERLKAKP